jgi:hypothetical protein
MDNKKHIDKMAEEALSSIDGAERAIPKPYLLTRVKARMDRKNETVLERSGSFILRPVFVIAGLCLVIGINALVIAFNKNTADTDSYAVNEQTTSADEFGTTVATLYDIENNEP